MTMVALLLKPWVNLMRAHGIEPRTLTDDLFMYASGKRHGVRMASAMEKSREYFADIGAKVADNKCFVTSTCQGTRQALRHHQWKGNIKIPVVNNFRDLGSHICFDGSGAACTFCSGAWKKRQRW